MIKVYEYEKCSTCRKALKFLDERKVGYERVPIVERPPSKAELEEMARRHGGEFRRLLNTSGQLYRELGLGAKAASMKASEAIDLLARHGKLVKRPFVLGGGVALLGFKEEEWRKAFG